MSKKYKTWEVLKALTDNPKLEFETTDMSCGGVKSVFQCGSFGYFGCYSYDSSNTKISEDMGNFNGNFDARTEWTLVQQEPVEFRKAIKAHCEGKTISCKVDGREYVYKNYGVSSIVEMRCQTGGGLSPAEILNGTWYIKEE